MSHAATAEGKSYLFYRKISWEFIFHFKSIYFILHFLVWAAFVGNTSLPLLFSSHYVAQHNTSYQSPHVCFWQEKKDSVQEELPRGDADLSVKCYTITKPSESVCKVNTEPHLPNSCQHLSLSKHYRRSWWIVLNYLISREELDSNSYRFCCLF